MKIYNGEPAIISLTSWKHRIYTVGKTIFSLIKNCPNFHIVLVLSIDEFPQKEKELPKELQALCFNNLIEILWVQKNYKAFKKILFTMDKYRKIPIISADDDCIYITNYAKELYDTWIQNKQCIVSYKNTNWHGLSTTWGCATLYPPYYFNEFGIKYLSNKVINIGLDDNYYMVLRKKLELTKSKYINKSINKILFFHDENMPLHNIYNKNAYHIMAYKQYTNLINI